MAKEILGIIYKVQDEVKKDIPAGLLPDEQGYAVGYAKGYLQALQDVEAYARGSCPQKDVYWLGPMKELGE